MTCSRCGGFGGTHEMEGPYMVYIPCYHCRDEGACDCDECRWRAEGKCVGCGGNIPEGDLFCVSCSDRNLRHIESDTGGEA